MALRFEKEKYGCPTCEKSFNYSEASESWKCALCGGYIDIQAEDGKGRKHVVNRISVEELVPNQQVVMPGNGFELLNAIIEVRKKNGAYQIAIREYGLQRNIEPGSKFNVVVGGW